MIRAFLAIAFLLFSVVDSNADTYVDITSANDLQTAINNCASPSTGNVYWIRMAAGTYNVMNLQTRAYVHLLGNGTLNTDVWIKGERANGSTNDSAYQTILLTTTTTLKHLKVTCKNMRYPIHDDSVSAGASILIDDCWVEHLGNWSSDGSRYATYAESGWSSSHAHGCGTNPNMTVTIQNSTLIGRQYGSALYAHNNANFSAPSHIIATNNTLTQIDGGPAVYLANLGSHQTDTCVLTNNTINGAIFIDDAPWLGTASTNHAEWSITGTGNIYPYFYNNINSYWGDSTGKNYRYAGEYQQPFTNAGVATICQGCAAVYISSGKTAVKLMTSADSPALFAGISMSSVTSGSSGPIATAGQWMEADIYKDSSALAVGDTLAVDATTPGRLTKSAINPVVRYASDWAWLQGFYAFESTFYSGLAAPSYRLFGLFLANPSTVGYAATTRANFQ